MSGDGEWIEEGLFYRGSGPPDGDWNPRDWVELPHEHYIPVPKGRLTGALEELPKAKQAGVRFQHFLQLSEALLHFHYLKTLNELKEDYEYFDPDGGAVAREGVPEHELVQHERRFLANFLQTMIRGNFIPLDQAAYTRAMEQDYLMDVPVQVDWRPHDPTLLSGFYGWADGTSDEAKQLRKDLGIPGELRELLSPPEEVGTNALVFYRGIDRDQATGMFMTQKVDLLISRLFKVLLFPILFPLQLLIAWARGYTEPSESDPSGEAPPPPERTTVFQPRWVRRKNLKNISLLRSLFKPLRLQEPALRQVITLFRLKPLPGLLGKVSAFRKRETGLPARDWTIRIKTFSHIPLADAEIVFPEKILRMRSFDIAMLIITAGAAIPALLRGITKGGGAAFVVVALLAAFAWKLVSRYRRVRRDYVARVTKDLYEKSLDNSMGVLQFLVDSLEAQELKEAALVYTILWEAGEPLSEQELDARIERFLDERFQIEIDYEVEDALEKVVDRGPETHPMALPVVERVGEGADARYRAKPLDQALEVLDAKWDGLFEYHHAPEGASA